MAYNFTQFKSDVKKVEERLVIEFLQVQTGRASPAVLDSIMVESYGTRQPLKNVGSISIEDPKTLRIAPWDKSQIKDIEKSIIASNLGISVVVDDLGLRIIFPMLTTETRGNLVKVLKDKLEEARISLRKEREGVWNDIQAKETEGSITEDDKFRAKDELQKIIDETNKNLELLFEKKEKEVMS